MTLYKVGHHGSLNATPKSLWALFEERKDRKENGRLKCVVSTLAGKHGSKSRRPEVPREKLMNALDAGSELLRTDTRAASLLEAEILVPLG